MCANKIVKIMQQIHKLDWSPDSAYSLRNRPIRYVSVAKMKRQINPILDQNECYIIQTARGSPIIEQNRIIQAYDFYLGGDGVTSPVVTYYGEGSNEGKQCITAATNAYRAFCIGFFGIVDGMDDGEADIPASKPVTIKETAVAQDAKRDDVSGQDAPTGSESKLSGIMRLAVENALFKLIESDIPEEQKIEGQEMHDKIQNIKDANAFLEFKKKVCG